jgi:calmodulin-lysine N-methyltransferase
VAAYCCAKEVILTDGNQRSIDNINAIIERNVDRFKCKVSCKLLEWGNDAHMNDLDQNIDIIVCSDCLYFDDSRQQLVDTIWKFLHNSGSAMLLAPTRGESLQNFVDLAKEKFLCQQMTNYDSTVWE